MYKKTTHTLSQTFVYLFLQGLPCSRPTWNLVFDQKNKVYNTHLGCSGLVDKLSYCWVLHMYKTEWMDGWMDINIYSIRSSTEKKLEA